MISLQLSKSVQGDDGALARLQLPLAIATANANHIRRRAQQGRFATAPAPNQAAPKTRKGRTRPYRVSQQYAQLAGVQGTDFASSADFHRAVGRAPGNTTGGMWRGLQVRNYGGDSAIIEFAGSSTSSRPRRVIKTRAVQGEWLVKQRTDGSFSARQKRTAVRDEDGKAKIRVAQTEQNRLKAAAVFRHSRIGLLQMTPAEEQAVVSAVAESLGHAVAAEFGTGIRATRDGDSALRSSILGNIRR